MNIYQHIISSIQKGQKLLAVLIDPEKLEIRQIRSFIKLVNQSIATHIFVGGSTDTYLQTKSVIVEIKKHTSLPVILFPGDVNQITPEADAILFLSLISGRNPEYLIEQQIAAVPKLKEGRLEVIPTGYILIDGGTETSVQKISNTRPISQHNTALIVNTALAGEYSGKKLIYLEADSGAMFPVNKDIIRTLKKELTIPLIVGGGIQTRAQLDSAFNAGADMVVIGTTLEKNPQFFNELKQKNTYEHIR